MKKLPTIPYSRQSMHRKDIEAVVRVLKSDWLTQGPAVEVFESKLAEATGARYAVTVANGTAALHLACLALGVKKGDRVITSPITFAASANCILYAGGQPSFCDIHSETFNMDANRLTQSLNKGVTGVIPVHFGGRPCEMPAIARTARKKKLFILEDGCHALGARYRAGGRWHRVGDCAHSDACVFSFHPVKGITTGEGGAITTNDVKLYERLKLLRSHGITKSADLFQNKDMAFWKKDGQRKTAGWYYEMQKLGFNYRITDIQCALGISQLARLEEMIGQRRAIAAFYDKQLAPFDLIQTPAPDPDYQSAYHLYPIRLRLEKLSAGRAEIFDALRARGLGVQVHYIPVHLQPYYRKLGFYRGQYPAAENYYERTISIPVFPGMTQAMRRRVVATLRDVLEIYRR